MELSVRTGLTLLGSRKVRFLFAATAFYRNDRYVPVLGFSNETPTNATTTIVKELKGMSTAEKSGVN
jgi:hypothetical protein